MRKITYITSTFVALMALQAQPINADNINKVSANQLTCPTDAVNFISKRPKKQKDFSAQKLLKRKYRIL